MSTLSRREVLGGGLALGFFASRGWAATSMPAVVDGVLKPSVFLSIAKDGLVTIVCHRSEMGQGVRSSLPVLIADELGADMARVKLVQADGDEAYGDQNTDGSSSIRKRFTELRAIGATPRMMLVAAAAKQWKVNPEECVAKGHQVRHTRSKRVLDFGALAVLAAKEKVPAKADVKLRLDSELEHVGTELSLLDAQAYVDGSAKFGADVRLPGMLVAVIARPKDVGGTVVSVDDAKAKAVKGVQAVVRLPEAKRPWGFQPWGGVAVLATDTWAAMQGRAALNIQWGPGPFPEHDSEKFLEELKASVAKPGKTMREVGDVDGALKSAAKVVEAEYHVPHLAHAPMEPPVALANVTKDACEVWAPTQHPQSARNELAKLLGLPKEKITVHVTFLGGGFGRKSKPDFVLEAAWLSKQVQAPVRVQWTREDDLQHGYYNAVSYQRLTAGLAADGTVTAWRHRTAYPQISTTFGMPGLPQASDLQQGVLDLALGVPNVRAESCAAESRVRVGWMRSVYNIFHAFSVGSFIDELAHASGADPKAKWLEVLGPPRQCSLQELGIAALSNYGADLKDHPVDAGRLRHVLERVTEMSGWNERKAQGRALGLAAHRSFLAYTAVVAQVSKTSSGKLSLDEVWVAFDAGQVVNLDRVKSQLEGSVAFGLSIFKYGEISMKRGATVQSNFHDYKLAHIGEMPKRVHLEVVKGSALPSGVGEPGVPPVAPAIANAWFALTGERIRRLPMERRT